jgi:hypothetical protein
MFLSITQFNNNINKGGIAMKFTISKKPIGQDSVDVEKGERKDSKSWNKYLLAGGLAIALGTGCNDVNVTKVIPIPAGTQGDAAVSDGSGASQNGPSEAGTSTETANDSKGPVDDSGKTQIGPDVDGGVGSDAEAVSDSGNTNTIDGNGSEANTTVVDSDNPNAVDGGATDGIIQLGDVAGSDVVIGTDTETGQNQDDAGDATADSGDTVPAMDGGSQTDGIGSADGVSEAGGVALDTGGATDVVDGITDAVVVGDSNKDGVTGNDSVSQNDSNAPVSDGNQSDGKLVACNNPGVGKYYGYLNESVPMGVGGFAFEFDGLGPSAGGDSVKISIKCADDVILPATLFQTGVETILDTVDNKRIRITPYSASNYVAFVNISVEDTQGHDGGTADAGEVKDSGSPIADAGTCNGVTTGAYNGYIYKNGIAQVAGYDVRYTGLMTPDGGQQTIGAKFDIIYNGNVIADDKECALDVPTRIEFLGTKQTIEIIAYHAYQSLTYVDVKVTCP